MYITPFERTYICLLEKLSLELLNIGMLRAFSLLYYLRIQRILCNRKDCILEKMNIDIENHSNGYFTLSVSTLFVKVVPFCMTFLF